MTKQTYYQWHADWVNSRPHERLGQAFVNDFIDKPWPYLFHCEDSERAGRIIYYYLTDHCYWPNMPDKLPQEVVGVEVIHVADWNLCLRLGTINEYDGIGYWGDIHSAFTDKICFAEQPAGATHVHWYAK